MPRYGSAHDNRDEAGIHLFSKSAPISAPWAYTLLDKLGAQAISFDHLSQNHYNQPFDGCARPRDRPVALSNNVVCSPHHRLDDRHDNEFTLRDFTHDGSVRDDGICAGARYECRDLPK